MIGGNNLHVSDILNIPESAVTVAVRYHLFLLDPSLTSHFCFSAMHIA